MSSQKGNASRQRPQKHCNNRRFKNNLNDKSPRVQTMNSIDLKTWELCKRCIDVIQWKITYKKYKPLTQPKKCIKCEGKCVKRAYCVVCSKCADEKDICAKCLKNRQDDDEQLNSLTTNNANKLPKKAKKPVEANDGDENSDHETDKESDGDGNSSHDEIDENSDGDEKDVNSSHDEINDDPDDGET